MNKLVLFGIVLMSFLVISLTVLPGFSIKNKEITEISLPVVQSVILYDVVEANGKKTFWELTAILDGNLIQSTKNLEGTSKGAGIMIKPDNDHVYTVGVHTYNNCESFDCGNYKVHGHVSRIVESSETCSNSGYEFESISGSVQDLGIGHITYKPGQDKTVLRLGNIDAIQNELANPELVCNNNANSNVGVAYLYNTQVIPDSENNIHLCVHLSDPLILENTSINGFTSNKTPNLCELP
jgi:hypothetical protein